MRVAIFRSPGGATDFGRGASRGHPLSDGLPLVLRVHRRSRRVQGATQSASRCPAPTHGTPESVWDRGDRPRRSGRVVLTGGKTEGGPRPTLRSRAMWVRSRVGLGPPSGSFSHLWRFGNRCIWRRRDPVCRDESGIPNSEFSLACVPSPRGCSSDRGPSSSPSPGRAGGTARSPRPGCRQTPSRVRREP